MRFLGWLINPGWEIDRLVERRVDEYLDRRTEPSFQDLWDYVLEQNKQMTRLGNQMTAFLDQVAALDAVTNDLADKFEALEAVNAELRAAVAAGDQVRAEALAAQSAEHANVLAAGVAKLRGLGADSENPVPDTEPLPDVPPVEPAA